MGTHLRVLGESYPMNTNITRLRCFQKISILMFWTNVASILEGLREEIEQREVVSPNSSRIRLD